MDAGISIADCSSHVSCHAESGNCHMNPAFDHTSEIVGQGLATISGSLPARKYSATHVEGSLSATRRIGCCKNMWLSVNAAISQLPCFPSWSRCTRLVTLWLLTLATWTLALLLIGTDVLPPSGPLWKLILLSVAAKVGGWMTVQIRLPGLLGMLLVGIGLQAAGVVTVEGPYLGLVRFIRKASLVIIMMRAGLDLDPAAMRRLKFAILRLGWMPWALEATCVAVLASYLFNLSIGWAIVLGVVEGAVSPAVVVPNLILLRSQGFGVAKGVPTLVLAVTGIEDAIAIAAYGVATSIMFSTGSLVLSIIKGPGSVILGIAAGAFLGLICRFLPDYKDPYMISLRIFVLLLGGLIVVLGSDRIGMGGAGPLAVIVAAYTASVGWVNRGWRVGENAVALTFGVIWQFFEPVVFGLVGAQLRVDELPADTVGLAAACVLAPAVIRLAFTMLLLSCGTLNLKEKVFVSLSWMAKATVQAVLGPAVLDLTRDSGDPVALTSAQVVFIVSVLSILLTAPLGAVLIATTGPRLLKRN